MLGVSQKAEALNISPCCCDKDPSVCYRLCGYIQDYYCNGMYCICGSKRPPVQFAQTNGTTNLRIWVSTDKNRSGIQFQFYVVYNIRHYQI